MADFNQWYVGQDGNIYLHDSSDPNHWANGGSYNDYLNSNGTMPNWGTIDWVVNNGQFIGDPAAKYANNGTGDSGSGEDPYAFARAQAAAAAARESAAGRLTRDSALAAIEGATRDRDFALGQLEKDRAAQEEILRRALEQSEQDNKVQEHINSADWRGGENSALQGASTIETSGANQLANKGVGEGSMLNALNNMAINTFGSDQAKVNQDYGKKASEADRNINLARKKNQYDIAEAWDKMMAESNRIRNSFANQVRELYGNAASGELQAGGNPQTYLNMQKGVESGIDYDRRAPTIDTTYTAKPISSFYKNANVGVSNASKDNRIYGTTKTAANTNTQETSANAEGSTNTGGANES